MVEQTNTVFTLMQNSYNLGININQLIKYIAIVQNETGEKPDECIEHFARLFERINNTWARNNKEWKYIKFISEKHEIELKDQNGKIESFSNVFSLLLHCYHNFSVFTKSEFITAMAGESNRDTLLVLAENYRNNINNINADAVNKIATAMLESIYNNRDGGISNG